MAAFLREIAALIRNSNAQAIAQRLQLSSTDSPKRQYVDSLSSKSYQAANTECERQVSGDWAEVVCHSCLAASAVKQAKLDEACKHQEAAVEAFLRVFKTLTRAWLPVFYALLVDLRKIASDADAQAREADGGVPNESGCLEAAGRVMRKCLAQELRDEDNDKSICRSWGALFVANQCNKIFFRLNTLKHVKSLVLPTMVSIDEYPLADRVTWRFFQGRVAMLDGMHDKAEADLSFAFNNTPPAHAHNRRVVLCYLIPVRLLLYQNKPSPTRRAAIPTQELLEKYKLPEFKDLVRAFVTGNVMLFDEALEEHMDFFVGRSIYLLLHKLKLCVYRNLFKRAYNVEKKSQVKLDVFVAAVRACGCKDVEPEQVECMLANLIFSGMVKGYIAHKQKTVVLKKDDPFRTVG
mmetsp:Transcript_34614/g.81117  ORF Transcript_34614/g.81117 Transcript_34614/m.81117 type:complete len:407 (+) Transcript_34614:15-1235(+)